jgi:hypothetical protein
MLLKETTNEISLYVWRYMMPTICYYSEQKLATEKGSLYVINILCINENVACRLLLNCVNVKEIKCVEEYFRSNVTARVNSVREQNER